MTKMLARPVEPFAKIDDPHFNHAAAQKAYDLVMKMDIDEARVFCAMVVGDDVVETISKNLRSAQSHLNGIVAKSLSSYAVGVHKTVISKRMADEPFDEEHALATAGAVALLSKAVEAPFRETNVRRDARGRFTFEVKPTPKGTKAMTERSAVAAGIPENVWMDAKQIKSPQRRADFQHRYLQIANTLSAFSDDDDATLIIRTKGGRLEEVALPQGTRKGQLVGSWNPKDEQVVGVTVRPKNLQVGGATFETMQALGADADAASMRGRQMQAVDREIGGFARDWTTSGNAYSGTSRTFGQMKAGSQFVGQIAPVGSKAQLAASFGEFVGSKGPEAEKVIGPKARKTAYRYRGVTKTPESALVREYERRYRPAQTPELTDKIKSRQSRALTAARIQGKKLTPEAENKIRNKARVAVLSDTKGIDDTTKSQARIALVRSLKEHQRITRKKPSGDLYDLQLASGHTPPSEGLLINRNGEVVAQAIGYADDHYLPFNLKQLGALRGGEYVRTRSVGGPTSEDIYAAYMAGASSFVVSSRSGTFEVQFEDDFRGKRRYNDKAKRMTDRYEKLLDAVESGQVSQARDTPATIRNLAAKKVEGLPEGERNKEYRRQIATIKQNGLDEDYVEDLVDEYAGALAGPGGDPEEWKRQARNDIKQSSEHTFRLNGRGYAAALDALREQFPYYIKDVRYIENDVEESGLTAKDRGYVKPRHNRPTEAQAGYFDATITGAGKISAANVDYQNSGVALKARLKTEAEQKAKAESTAPAAAGETPKAKKTDAEPSESQKQSVASAAGALWRGLSGYGFKGAAKEAKEKIGTAEELEAEVKAQGTTGPRYVALQSIIDASAEDFQPDEKTALKKLENARAEYGSKPYDADDRFVATDSVPRFADVDAITNWDAYDAIAKTVDQESLTNKGKMISAMNDSELRAEIEAAGRVQSVVKDALEAGSNRTPEGEYNREGFNAVISRSGFDRDSAIFQDALNGRDELFKKRVDRLHKQRALTAMQGRLGARQTKATPTTIKQPEDEETVRGIEQAVNEAFPVVASPKIKMFRDAMERTNDGLRKAEFDTAANFLEKEQHGISLSEWERGVVRQAEERLKFMEQRGHLQ